MPSPGALALTWLAASITTATLWTATATLLRRATRRACPCGGDHR